MEWQIGGLDGIKSKNRNKSKDVIGTIDNSVLMVLEN